MSNVIEFRLHSRGAGGDRVVAPAASYREIMAAIRGLRRVPGFASDAVIAAQLQRPYERLVRLAESTAPSRRMFESNMRQLDLIRAS